MPGRDPEKTRSLTLLGAPGSGKTRLAEALLYRSGTIHHLGQSGNGSRILDTDPEEIKRETTLISKIQSLAWDGHQIHLADTPGYADFIGEALGPLALLDAVVLVVDATTGVDIATQQLYKQAVQLKKPIIFFINKMDKEHANFQKCLQSIQKNLSKHAYPIALPLGEGPSFKGVLDLMDKRAFLLEKGEEKLSDIPQDQLETFQNAQKLLIEEVAETEENLFEKLASGENLTKEEILPQLLKDIEEEEILPVLVGSAGNLLGITLLLDTLTHLLVPPTKLPPKQIQDLSKNTTEDLLVSAKEPCVAQVFKIFNDPGVGDLYFLKILTGSVSSGHDLVNAKNKERERLGHLITFKGKERKEISQAIPGDIIAVAKLKQTTIGDTLCEASQLRTILPLSFPEPVFSVSLQPKTRKDQDRLGPALHKLRAADPTLKFNIDPEFHETVLSGMGEVHLDIMVGRLKEKYNIELELGKPKIAYRETITSLVKAQGKYKKQTGGHGQFGDVWIKIEPQPLGHGFEFVNAIKGGVIPSKYIPSVETGIKEAMQKGTFASYPVVDIKVTLYDGSFHSVDSSDLAFQVAGSMAFKKCEAEAHPILLEPIMHVEVSTPSDYVGPITNDLTSRRGKILGMHPEGEMQVMDAEVPLADLFKYATDLRSMTHGAGVYRMSFDHYEAVPNYLADKIVKEHRAEASH